MVDYFWLYNLNRIQVVYQGGGLTMSVSKGYIVVIAVIVLQYKTKLPN
jgi:hypothetical protein